MDNTKSDIDWDPKESATVYGLPQGFELPRPRSQTRAYLVIDDEGLVPLALVWARDACNALAYVLGYNDVKLCETRYQESGRTNSRLAVVARVDGVRRAFRVRLAEDAPVPAFVHATVGM